MTASFWVAFVIGLLTPHAVRVMLPSTKRLRRKVKRWRFYAGDTHHSWPRAEDQNARLVETPTMESVRWSANKPSGRWPADGAWSCGGAKATPRCEYVDCSSHLVPLTIASDGKIERRCIGCGTVYVEQVATASEADAFYSRSDASGFDDHDPGDEAA